MERKKYIIILLTIVSVMTIGFAILSTSLSLDGTTTVKANTWNVKFQNIVVDTNNTVTATTAPSITDNTSINFAVSLSKPGDMFAFTVDAVNTGSIDAMVNSITKTSLTTAQNKFLCFDVFYENGSDILKYDKLDNTTGTKKLIVFVKYLENVDSEDLPSSAINLNLNFSIDFIQADSNAKTNDNQFIYSVSDEMQYYGDALPSMTTYTTPASAISAFGAPVFIKHRIVNDLINLSYVGMKKGDSIVYLKVYDLYDVYDRNKYVLGNLFKNSEYSCENDPYDGGLEFRCNKSNYLDLYTSLYSGNYSSGGVLAYKNSEGLTFNCAYDSDDGLTTCTTYSD